MNISRGYFKSLHNNSPIQLIYFQSNAINPPDKLIINSKEFIIKPGLKVILNRGDLFSVISKDKNSYRCFSRKKIIKNKVINRPKSKLFWGF